MKRKTRIGIGIVICAAAAALLAFLFLKPGKEAASGETEGQASEAASEASFLPDIDGDETEMVLLLAGEGGGGSAAADEAAVVNSPSSGTEAVSAEGTNETEAVPFLLDEPGEEIQPKPAEDDGQPSQPGGEGQPSSAEGESQTQPPEGEQLSQPSDEPVTEADPGYETEVVPLN